jgi:protoheme IX farnesyltransferase
MLTGMAGYMSARCPVITWNTLVGLAGSLFFIIAGSTVLNMVLDRDLDARMQRTCTRPLPSGKVAPSQAAVLGVSMAIAGITWGWTLAPQYGVLIALGLLFDVLVYTLWLKRRTPWSILWGGVAGGMPILAGRTLGTGSIDWIGLTLAAAVLCWIPTHIMTFSIRHQRDYANAGIPTFPAVYGVSATRIVIAGSSLGAAAAMALAGFGIGMAWGYLRVLVILAIGLLMLAAGSILRPSAPANLGLFKYASIFMLGAMVLIMVETGF